SGRVDRMMALARAEADLTSRVVATDVRWEEDSLRVRVRAELIRRDGEPVLFRRQGAAIRWEPSHVLDLSDSETHLLDVTHDLPAASCVLNVQTRAGLVEHTFHVLGGVVLEPVGEQVGDPHEPTDPNRVRVVFQGWAQVPTAVL